MSYFPEEILTLEEIMSRYHDGPDSGIFTDGSARPNPGPGGWGVVYVERGKIIEQRYGSDADTTNNRMELTALIEAYKLAPPNKELSIYTDSELCVKTITLWAKGWEAKGWKRKTGPIANLELVRKLYTMAQLNPKISLQWVKAHNGWLWNEYADGLSTAWARKSL